jgi:tetratricopeptide (TPR) repeat protein
MGPRELYDATGDSEGAMRLMVSESKNNNSTEQTPQQEYNCLLLTALATSTTTPIGSSNSKKKKKGKSGSKDDDVSLLNESLEDARTVVKNSHSGNLRNKRAIAEDWVLAYNRGLVLLSKGSVVESIQEAWSYLQPVIHPDSSSSQPQTPPLELACRMGFLILEGLLTLYPTRIHGQTSDANHKAGIGYEEDSSFDLRMLDTVLAWLTENVELTKAPPTQQTTGVASDNQHPSEGNAAAATATVGGGPDPQLKFLLSLYESRVNFFERTTGDASIRDKHMRSARKELKQAMEIFQHKLRPERADTSSLASISSEVTGGGNSSNNDGKETQVDRATSPPLLSSSTSKNHSQLSRILQGQNQAALNLKANAEQLKGNAKKSLVLCGEAQSFNSSESGSSSSSNSGNSSYYDAIHQNNLAIVYESRGKSHLALHAFSKAVRSAIESNNANTNHCNFESDGTARPDVTLHVLNNAAVCSLKSRNYPAAYECYAIGLATSNSWRKRSRTWLRLSEACIGLNAKVQKERAEGVSKCSKVEVDG